MAIDRNFSVCAIHQTETNMQFVQQRKMSFRPLSLYLSCILSLFCYLRNWRIMAFARQKAPFRLSITRYGNRSGQRTCIRITQCEWCVRVTVKNCQNLEARANGKTNAQHLHNANKIFIIYLTELCNFWDGIIYGGKKKNPPESSTLILLPP